MTNVVNVNGYLRAFAETIIAATDKGVDLGAINNDLSGAGPKRQSDQENFLALYDAVLDKDHEDGVRFDNNVMLASILCFSNQLVQSMIEGSPSSTETAMAHLLKTVTMLQRRNLTIEESVTPVAAMVEALSIM